MFEISRVEYFAYFGYRATEKMLMFIGLSTSGPCVIQLLSTFSTGANFLACLLLIFLAYFELE